MKQLFRIRGFLSYTIMLFINAFVDLGHKIVIQNTVFKIYDGQTQVILTAIVNALILLPFIWLFSPAGFLSDKYPKHLVMRYSAWAAVLAVLVITLSYYEGWFWCAFAMTLVLGVQAAIYSPAKYGFIRELVGDHNLAQGNAVVQAATIVAILGGTFVFSGLFESMLREVTIDNTSTIVHAIAPIGWLLVGLTLVELWLAYQLPATREKDEEKRFVAADYFQGAYLRRNLTAINSNRDIWIAIIGLSMFWAISQVVLASFPAYAKDVLSETNTLVIQGILACSGIGIIVGSLVAGRISRNYIELGFIPAGMLGFSLALGLMPALETRAAMVATFMALGFLGGFFIVPLNALVQYYAGEDELGTVLAGNNWIQNIAMLGFLGVTILLAWVGISSTQLFYVLMAVALMATFYTVYRMPHSLARIFATVLIRRRISIDVRGFDNLPKSGSVLLSGNHISATDRALVQIACPRPVCFFSEGDISQTAHGLIVPFFLRSMGGSHFLCRRVSVTFGKPLPINIEPGQLNRQIFELSSDMGEYHA